MGAYENAVADWTAVLQQALEKTLRGALQKQLLDSGDPGELMNLALAYRKRALSFAELQKDVPATGAANGVVRNNAEEDNAAAAKLVAKARDLARPLDRREEERLQAMDRELTALKERHDTVLANRSVRSAAMDARTPMEQGIVWISNEATHSADVSLAPIVSSPSDQAGAPIVLRLAPGAEYRVSMPTSHFSYEVSWTDWPWVRAPKTDMALGDNRFRVITITESRTVEAAAAGSH